MSAATTGRPIGLAIGGTAAAALGAVGLWQASHVRQPSSYQALGPRVFPTVVSLGLLALGLAFVARVLLRPDRALLETAANERATSELRTPLLMLAGVVAYAYALPEVGYVVATTAFFPIAARLLGSDKPVRDAAIGVVLSIALFELFTQVLGVRLPAGPLASVL